MSSTSRTCCAVNPFSAQRPAGIPIPIPQPDPRKGRDSLQHWDREGILGPYSSCRFNLDGFLTVDGPRERGGVYQGYCLAFRRGTVEIVDAETTGRMDKDGPRYIPSVAYERDIIGAMGKYLIALSSLQVPLPIVVALTFLGVKDCHFPVSERLRLHRWEQVPIDRDVLVLPDVLIEAYNCDIPTILRPIFDAVWNAAGWEKSANYDEQGTWRAHE